MNRILRYSVGKFFLVLTLLCLSGIAFSETVLPEQSRDWYPLGKYWHNRRIGNQDFYLAEQGNYIRIMPENSLPYLQCGIFPVMIPGHWRLQEFSPEAKLAAWQESCVDNFLQNQWPLFSINYQRMQGNPAPSQEAIQRVQQIWIGDGQPEEPIYRLEPVFHFLQTGEKWQGSSMHLWKDEPAVAYLKDELVPLLEERLPGCSSPDYQWNRERLQILKETYCLSYLSINALPLCWTMYLTPYQIAAKRPEIVSVAAKGGDAFLMAQQRGVARQSGGNKFLLSWRGHEPTERFAYPDREFFTRPERENWGFPLPHLRYYLFRPFLCGVNYYVNEGFPGGLIHDFEGDGNWEPTPLGRIFLELLDYRQRQPERGTVYTPVAVLQGWNRVLDLGGYADKVEFDRADWMNYALIRDLLLPEHRHVRNSGSYTVTAPMGEIIDILKPDPRQAIDPLILDGYKLLIWCGGGTVSDQYLAVLQNYVASGGSLLLNAADAAANFPESFTGVRVGGTFLADSIEELASGKRYVEESFLCHEMDFTEAEVLYTVAGGKAAVTRYSFGKGSVIVCAPEYLLTLPEIISKEGRQKTRTSRPLLLNFCADFFRGLLNDVSPFEVSCSDENRPDLSWQVSRLGDRWLLTVFNYSLKREELQARSLGTANVVAEYPYQAIPFTVRGKIPFADIIERFEGREVQVRKEQGTSLIDESIRGGEIRVYEFSPGKITLPAYQRPVNYALQRPVRASSTYRSFVPGYVVDGKVDNAYFWQSASEKRSFNLPQELEIDLQQEREIHRIDLFFHVWPEGDPEARQTVYRYQIEGSQDGKQWQLLVDESRNEKTAHKQGEQHRLTTPQSCRWLKVRVLRNSAQSGAQIVEFAAYGPDRELFQPERRSIDPKWKVDFPEEIQGAPPAKVRYLRHLKPLSVRPGWMPTGKKWEDLNGWVRLFTDIDNLDGPAFPNSLYGESSFEAEYAIPADSRWFVSVCGFGNRSRAASVVFQVYIDDELHFDSGVYRLGNRLLPVLLDVSGRDRIKLVTTDAGDGLIDDYAWWGDARFITR